MNDLDRKIQEALREMNPNEPLSREPNLAEEVIATMRGRHRWINTVVFVYTFVFFAIAVWSGIKFYGAETVQVQLQWGGLCLLGLLITSFVKVYFWMEMHTNRVLREVKRVELLFLQKRDKA